MIILLWYPNHLNFHFIHLFSTKMWYFLKWSHKFVCFNNLFWIFAHSGKFLLRNISIDLLFSICFSSMYYIFLQFLYVYELSDLCLFLSFLFFFKKNVFLWQITSKHPSMTVLDVCCWDVLIHHVVLLLVKIWSMHWHVMKIRRSILGTLFDLILKTTERYILE